MPSSHRSAGWGGAGLQPSLGCRGLCHHLLSETLSPCVSAAGDCGLLGHVRQGSAQPLRGDAQAPGWTDHSGDGHGAGTEPELFRCKVWAGPREAPVVSPAEPCPSTLEPRLLCLCTCCCFTWFSSLDGNFHQAIQNRLLNSMSGKEALESSVLLLTSKFLTVAPCSEVIAYLITPLLGQILPTEICKLTARHILISGSLQCEHMHATAKKIHNLNSSI